MSESQYYKQQAKDWAATALRLKSEDKDWALAAYNAHYALKEYLFLKG